MVLAGCGGSDGGGGSTTPASAPPTTTPAPPPTATTTTPAPTTPAPATPPPTSTTPQQSPGEGDGTGGGGGGGGGGTEPARTELTFTGSSAGVTPRNAGVAPYISVKVSLVSKDGTAHKLVVDGKTLAVGGTRGSAFVTLPGLRPGKSYRGKADGNTTIRILSTSEPGP